MTPGNLTTHFETESKVFWSRVVKVQSYRVLAVALAGVHAPPVANPCHFVGALVLHWSAYPNNVLYPANRHSVLLRYVMLWTMFIV